MRYTREDFAPVPGVPGQFYCPGCNASNDDYALPSIGCPCEHFGSGNGALHADGVKAYLWVEDNYVPRSDWLFQANRADEEHRLRVDAEKRERELRRGIRDSGAAERAVAEVAADRNLRGFRARLDLVRALRAIDRIYGNGPPICSKLHSAHLRPEEIVTPEGRSVDCPICCPSLPELVDGHLHYRKLARREVEAYRDAIARFRSRESGRLHFREVIEFFEAIDLIDKAREAAGE